MSRIPLSKDKSWRYPIRRNKFERFMDRMTDWMITRYARFAFIGLSVIAGVMAALGTVTATHNYEVVWLTILMLANGFLAGWNFRRYRRDYWNGQ